MKKLFIIPFAILCISCADQAARKELETIKSENAELKKELLIYKTDPKRVLQQIKDAITLKKDTVLYALLDTLEKYHPQSEERREAKLLWDNYSKMIENKIAEENKKAEKEKNEKYASLNRLKKKYDDISGITWYSNPYFKHNVDSNLASIYLGVLNKSVWIRLVMSYSGDDWIFFKRAYLSYDGNTLEIPFNEYEDKESDHSSGIVWEWIDLTATDYAVFFEEFSKSKNAKMRLVGKYNKTRNLSQREINGFKDVIIAYNLLKEEYK